MEHPPHLRHLSDGVLPSASGHRSYSTDSVPPSSLPPLFKEAKHSEEEEMEAVEALLSIKQSYLPPLSPEASTPQDEVACDQTYFFILQCIGDTKLVH